MRLDHRVAAYPLRPEALTAWLAKGTMASAPLVASAGAMSHPGPVRTQLVPVADAVLGGFMPCWPEDLGEYRVIHHLGDSGFFLALLAKAYAPVFEHRPELLALLRDGSRMEVAITNDVLQAQLRQQPLTMIRHHSLMLFHGLLWLAEPARTGWVRLYREVADHAVAHFGGAPPLGRLAEVEAAAFADFERLAPRTHSPETAATLLNDTHALATVVEYQVLAALAVHVLWSDYQRVPAAQRIEWQRRELSTHYLRPDYLTRRWAELLTPVGGTR